jgi:uncharacterized membrane protein YccC
MRVSPKPLIDWLARGPNRIALSTALRGTLSTVPPLALFPHLGLGALAYPAVLGALAVSLVDIGGPYRSRLVAMLIQGLGGSCLLLLGMVAVGQWWLAAAVMAVIGVISGMIRALGPSGASLGINTAVAFLVGLQVGEGGAAAATPWALGYATGGLWTVLVALGFWQLRPYRRLEQEVASAWEAAADLVAAIGSEAAPASVVARRQREQLIAARHRAAREAIEAAREALGETRSGIAGPGTTVAQLLVLLNAAARIAAAVVTLGEIESDRAVPRVAATGELEAACRAVCRVLLDGKGELSLAPLRGRVEAARNAAPSAELLAWAQAMRHLDNAEEALRALFGERRRLFELLRLAIAHRRPRGAVIAALRPHMTPRSAIFRHALRVAAVTAIDTGVIAYFRLPHGIWLPLTSIVILQPDYGGTVTRALQRSGGTIAGAMLAGVLLATLHGTAEYDVVLGLLLFATFLLIRRRYGYGVTFLTPLIILLIGLGSADPWIDLAERIAYTVAGAVLAIGARFVLWPQWEQVQLQDRLVAALLADEAYLAAVLAALGDHAPPSARLAQLRREAEVAVANADAGFQRMLGDPRGRRAPVGAGFGLLVYLHRLCRHSIALAAQQEAAAAPRPPLETLSGLIQAALDDAAQALEEARPPAPRPDFDAPLAALVAALGDGTAAGLLGRLVSDVTGLLAAARSIAERTRSSTA